VSAPTIEAGRWAGLPLYSYPMAYYDTIAQHWHATTGDTGDAFKELVLNRLLVEKLVGLQHDAILELGAGNGYFLPFGLRQFSGPWPSRLIVTDQSERLLSIAKRHFKLPGAAYHCLDVRHPFPLAGAQFDVILASMLFSEVPLRDFRNALRECCRVLSSVGHLLMTVVHPDFVDNLQKSGLLKPMPDGRLTMPGSGSLRLPVVLRTLETYRRCLREAGLQYTEEEASPTLEVLNRKAGLRHAWKVPVALVYTCTKSN